VPDWFRFSFLYLLLCHFGMTHQSAFAQTPVSTSPTPNSRSAGAKLDFIAIDKDGRPVTDLKAEEVHLTLNKVEQKIESLTWTAGEPLTIGLFFDVSGSRRLDTHVAEETRLAGEFLRAIWHEGDSAFLVAFNEEPFVVKQPTQKLEEIDEGLEQIPGGARGATALYDALCLVKPEKLSAVPGRKVYVVFSDFEDNASRNKAERVLAVTRQAGISIFPFILGEGFTSSPAKKPEKRARHLAQTFADETGGEVLVPESWKQLPAVFQRLAGELQSTYRLTYDPSSPAERNGRAGRIHIETTREHVRMTYQKP